MFFKALTVAAAVASVAAQRPNGTSICDYYTTALLTNNTAVNQKTLLTLVVNTAVIGNYTKPNVGIAVPGILAKGVYNGVAVDLLPYFNGALASSNRGGMSGVSINFLDDGGAAPLMMNMPANGTSSNQYKLLTHLYEYFGALLGCSLLGTDGYPAYDGQASQFNVHKFMVLSDAQVGYFIQQVAMAAASFGVAESDLAVVGKALTTTFDYKCSPPATVIPAQGAQLQSICTGTNCTLDPMAACALYQNVTAPTPTASMSATMSATGSATATPTKAGAAAMGISLGAAIAGVAAFVL